MALSQSNLEIFRFLYESQGYLVVGDDQTHPVGYIYRGIFEGVDKIHDQPFAIIAVATKEEIAIQAGLMKGIGREVESGQFAFYYKVGTD